MSLPSYDSLALHVPHHFWASFHLNDGVALCVFLMSVRICNRGYIQPVRHQSNHAHFAVFGLMTARHRMFLSDDFRPSSRSHWGFCVSLDYLWFPVMAAWSGILDVPFNRTHISCSSWMASRVPRLTVGLRLTRRNPDDYAGSAGYLQGNWRLTTTLSLLCNTCKVESLIWRDSHSGAD